MSSTNHAIPTRPGLPSGKGSKPVTLPPPVRWPLQRPADGEPLVPELEQPAAPPFAASDLIYCPQCSEYAPIEGPACPHCGFPFSCDLREPARAGRAARMEAWRIILALCAVVMLLTTGGIYQEGVNDYQGYSFKLMTTLQPATDSGIPITGGEAFQARTELALGLIKQRAPEFYWRIQEQVAVIEYFSPQRLNSPLGRQIRMEGIGAIATPATREVAVLPTTAFPDGSEANDRALYNYAATLVHELRHIELHWAGQSPGGWQEEVLCEQAALAFLEIAEAPRALIAEKQAYLADPQAKRYQHWYDWYKQFD